jgi:hypothetical protein
MSGTVGIPVVHGREEVNRALPTVALPTIGKHRAAIRPNIGVGPLLAAIAVFSMVSAEIFDPHTTPLGWYVTVAWSLPALGSAVGIWGALSARDAWAAGPTTAVNDDPLIVLVPTIGRHDVLPGLDRTVGSFVRHMPAYHRRWRVDVVCEEHSEARDVIIERWGSVPGVRIVAIPAAYNTPLRTGFKARANQYMLERRRRDRDTGYRVWVLHMDDDTSCTAETAAAVASFVSTHNDPATTHPKHAAQGVLTYPREAAVNVFTWLADAVRPADDLSRFAAITGAGTPLAGMHGELMLMRSTVEDDIGWDFGPRTIVEDAQYALEFCARYPGRSAWIPAVCHGASPSTLHALIAQRRRWAWGLVMLALDRRVPWRRRTFLGYSVATWVLGPFQHIGVVLAAAFATHETASPASLAVIPLWAVNMGYVVWMYWTGLRVNQWASAARPRWWHLPATLMMIPLFSAIESWAAFQGLLYVIMRRAVTFTWPRSPRPSSPPSWSSTASTHPPRPQPRRPSPRPPRYR